MSQLLKVCNSRKTLAVQTRIPRPHAKSQAWQAAHSLWGIKVREISRACSGPPSLANSGRDPVTKNNVKSD